MIAIVATVVVMVAAFWWLSRPVPVAGAGTPAPTAGAAAEAAGGDLLIVYGSQTGTAAGFAKVLGRQAVRHGFRGVKVADAEDLVPATIGDSKAVLMVVATYGEGEPADNMKSLHDWLLDEERFDTELRGTHFAVFAIGDTQYKHYCQAGRVVDRRLAAIGGVRLCPLVEGDASASQEEAFDAWLQTLWSPLARALGVALRTETDEPIPPELTLRLWDESPARVPFPEAPPMLEPTVKQPVYATVVSNDSLLAPTVTSRQTRDIVLGFEGFPVTYQAGDHAGILCHNTDAAVAEALEVVDVPTTAPGGGPFRCISLADANGRNQLPARLSAADALRWYPDLGGPPRKSTLRVLAQYCADAGERGALLAVLRPTPEAEGRYRVLLADARTTCGVLRRFASCRVPLGHFLEAMPRLKPRYFSIATDQLSTAKSIGLTVARVDGGVCTSMLCAAQPGAAKVALFVRKSKFHLPMRAKTRPVLMIGPGTGVAPLIGFLHRRRAWRARSQLIGPALLFFGCRRPDEDFIHRAAMEAAAADEVVSALSVAFSREGPSKVYVQDRLRERAAEVWAHLQAGANIYLCGDARRMARDVERCLVDIVAEHGGMPRSAAEAFIEKMEADGTFHKDVWAA